MMLLSTNSNQTKSESKAGNACRRHTSCYGLRRKSLLRGLLFASGLLMLGSCIDSSYDLDDVDATIGLGVNGLKVKLGNTEKIYLKDIIDTDGNTKLDGNNQFYITEQGSTDLNYTVQKVNSTIDRLARVKTKFRVLRWSDDLLNQLGAPSGTQVTVPANYTLHGSAEGENKSDFTTDDIGAEVVRITRVYPRNFGASLTVRMKSSANVNFGLDKLQKFAVTLPQYVHLREIPAGWRLQGSTLIHDTDITIGTDSKQICAINIDYIDLKEEGTPKNGTITLPQEMTRVAMSGTAYFSSKSAFTMQQDDYADIELDINFPDDGKIVVDSIKGIFNPDINPNVNPIEIADNLPDFLKDDATKIKVSNPTLKFNVDMRTLPSNVNVGATLTSVKSGKGGWSQSVTLPQVTMNGGRANTAYYHKQGSKPYDPESEVAAGAIVSRVEDLGNLIERLPDQIEVDMKNGKVSLAQQEATMTLGKTYRARADYSVFVPLEMEEGFTIIYRDSTNSMEDDLKDYTAEGIQLKTMAENTIPLDLTLSVKALDQNGKPMPGVTFTSAKAKAGQGEGKAPVKSEMTVVATLQNPKDLQEIDHFLFEVKAESAQGSASQPLASQQYIRLTDIKLMLKGKVTVDLN